MPAKPALQPKPAKEFDPTRGFCCGDLITFACATVCRSIQVDNNQRGRPQGDKDISNEPAQVAIWLGIDRFVERLMEWDPYNKLAQGWSYTGETRTHLYHIVLAPGHGVLYVHDPPERRPGMKLVSAVA